MSLHKISWQDKYIATEDQKQLLGRLICPSTLSVAAVLGFVLSRPYHHHTWPKTVVTLTYVSKSFVQETHLSRNVKAWCSITQQVFNPILLNPKAFWIAIVNQKYWISFCIYFHTTVSFSLLFSISSPSNWLSWYPFSSHKTTSNSIWAEPSSLQRSVVPMVRKIGCPFSKETTVKKRIYRGLEKNLWEIHEDCFDKWTIFNKNRMYSFLLLLLVKDLSCNTFCFVSYHF